MIKQDHPYEYLDWDSTFFGLRIARVTENHLTERSLTTILSWCGKMDIDCLYFLSGLDDKNSIRLAEENDFHLVDVRVTLEHRLKTLPSVICQGPKTEIRPALDEDIAQLRRIARASHTDSRFFSDSHFPDKRCRALYETWIEKSIRGYADTVMVAVDDGRTSGYIACHLRDHGLGQIGLVAVAAESRGKKIGQGLVAESLHWFKDQGVEHVTVATQGRNAKAQALYQKCGFLTHMTQLWYHRWFNKHETDRT